MLRRHRAARRHDRRRRQLLRECRKRDARRRRCIHSDRERRHDRHARIRRVYRPGAELVIRFDPEPAGGTLAVSVAPDERASGQLVAGASGETLLVLPGELRVRNDARSTADYRVTVPPTVRRVRVHVGPGDANPVVVDVTPGTPRVVGLKRGPGAT